ncbi:MAG: secondary thiamine-phosphate synthase enzyme YjbQ [Candidatus Thermoplasmatota archaeon]
MVVYTDQINISTRGEGDIIDITQDVQSSLQRSELTNGLICIFIPGSTASISTMEYEPGLKKDIPKTMDRIAPRDINYHHHDTWHDDNGSSHVKASIIGPSLTVPFTDKRLTLGRWQQIVLLEFDTRPRKRIIILQIMGE